MRNGTIGTDGRVHCPYCNSVQVKEARNQPRKYPDPGFWMKLLHNKESTKGMTGFWLHGYDCKKCGNEFVIDPVTPAPAVTTTISPEPVTASYTLPTTPYTPEPVYVAPLPPAKKGGFLGKLILGIVVLGLAFMAWSWYQSQQKPTKLKQVKAKTDTKTVTAKSATPMTDKKSDIVVPPEPPKTVEPTPEPTKLVPAPVAQVETPKPTVKADEPKPPKAEKGEVNIDYVEPVKITETKTIKAN